MQTTHSRAAGRSIPLECATTDFPWRIVEVPPIPITRPVLPQHDPRRRRSQRDEQQPSRTPRPPPAGGHIIDEYAA